MPCDINDIDLNISPSTLNPIPGFGVPSSLSLPANLFGFPTGFPENLLDIFNKLQFKLPSGTLKPSLNPNFGKDIFDGIMKLLDKFFPFLMLYKFFLPILNLVVCIIEVICSLKNPFKLRRAILRLFRNCIPDFLSLFPIFALIVMIISLLLLLIQLIEYIIAQLEKLVKAILRNIKLISNAIAIADEESIIAGSKKLASLLCVFQNIFVILSAFAILIQAVKEILKIKFRIPPCDSDSSSNITEEEFLNQCCGTDVCPNVVKENINKTTGTLQNYNKVVLVTNVDLGYVVDPNAGTKLTQTLRESSFQLYDGYQQLQERFINVVDAYDIPSFIVPKPIFFPTDANYTALTNPKQCVYTVDLELDYDPSNYNRTNIPQDGQKRKVIFKDCIVLKAPTTQLNQFDNSQTSVSEGVLILAGGAGYEVDGTTKLYGYDSDGVTKTTTQATLENFLTIKSEYSTSPELKETDGIKFENVTYTFKPNFDVLFSKDLVTGGCSPDIEFSRVFINTTVGGDANARFAALTDLINSDGTNANSGIDGTNNPPFKFPNIQNTQDCLNTAIESLRRNVSEEQVAIFNTTVTLCLDNLKKEATNAIGELIGIGFDQYKSTFTIDSTLQFTTKKIKILVDLLDSNSQSITSGLTTDAANLIASDISANITFGSVSGFTYDNERYFVAEISSSVGGSGSVNIEYKNKQISVITIPDDLDVNPSLATLSLDYQFIESMELPTEKTRQDISDL